MLIPLYFVQSKYIKMHQQEITSIAYNILEFFYVTLYTDYFSDLNKKFQVTFTYDKKPEYKILNF